MKRIWAGLVGALLGAPAVAQESEASPYRSWTLRDVRVTTQDIFDEDEAIDRLALEVAADGFYAKTITIEH